MSQIEVIDALCGQGKSEWVIQKMKDNPKGKYLYIAPYLSECHRVAGTTFEPSDKKKRPLVNEQGDYIYDSSAKLYGFNFKHPDNDNGTKGVSLWQLMEQGENIVSTHALFTELGSQALEIAKEYTLIIDETVNVYEVDNRTKTVKDALEKGIIRLDEDGVTLRFARENFGISKDGRDTAKGSLYENIAAQCDLGQLLWINNSAVVWEMSSDLLSEFNSVIVCTYMFAGSEMKAYLDKKGLEYEIKSLVGAKKAKDVAHLIEVENDLKLNLVGANVSLSSTTVKSKTETGDAIRLALRNNMHNLFNRKWKCRANDRLWTSLKEIKSIVGYNNRYENQFLPFNYKATNDYINVHHVAFLHDVYINPFVKHAAYTRSNDIDQDLYAVSTMIQFIFRSAVRKGEPIKVYIPSKRMRDLLERWKNGEFDE